MLLAVLAGCFLLNPIQAGAVPAEAPVPISEPALRAEMAEQINRLRAGAIDCGDPLQVASIGPLTLPAPPARPALRYNAVLERAALRQARSMAEDRAIAHRAADGTTVRERSRQAGYAWRIIGENLGAGQNSVAEVVAQWFASATHCDNLLEARFVEFGIARVAAIHPSDPYRHYWALVLGAPRPSGSR